MRTIEDIQAQIDAAANEYPALSELQSNPSPVSVWRAMKAVFAFAAYALEKMLAEFKSEALKNIKERQIGTKLWYLEQLKAFQYGDLLIASSGRLRYARDNADKRIISAAGVKEGTQPGSLVVKALKEGGKVLTADELAAFSLYLNQIKIAGTQVTIQSLPANKIKLSITAELDRQRFDANGRLHGQGQPIIKDTIASFLRQMPFDGVFYLSRLEDALQAIEGVIDIHISSAHYQDGAESWQILERKYESPSGHLILDDDGSTLTYILNE